MVVPSPNRFSRPRAITGLIAIGLFWGLSNVCALADPVTRFGVARAQIAKAVAEHRWLVCHERNTDVSGESEVVGFDRRGNLFRIRGVVRSRGANLLSLDSYEDPRVTFSTEEGYLYCWSGKDGEDPFEVFMGVGEYTRIIEKFELHAMLGEAGETPLKFELLEASPEFYQRALKLNRPKSILDPGVPGAKRFKVGMGLVPLADENAWLVDLVLDQSAAKAAGIELGDVIVRMAINGRNVEVLKGFPVPEDRSIRLVSLRLRRMAEGRTTFVDVNLFVPSPLEQYLGRPLPKDNLSK
jgi:hypothetical protein